MSRKSWWPSLCNSLTFGRLRADERPGVAEALPPVGPVEGRRVGVEGDAGVAGVPLDAVEDFAAQGFAHAALAQLGALGIVEFVQLENNNEGIVISRFILMLKAYF